MDYAVGGGWVVLVCAVGCADAIDAKRDALEKSGMIGVDVVEHTTDDGAQELVYGGTRGAQFCHGVSKGERGWLGVTTYGSSMETETCVPGGDPREAAWRCHEAKDAEACAEATPVVGARDGSP